MRRWFLVLFAVCSVVACSGQSDPPLPVIHPDDPAWSLTPDHLDYGALPKVTQ